MTMKGLLHKPPKSKRSDSSNLNTNILRHRNDDVMEKYEIVRKIGEGSMGSISKAKIRDDRIGGSAYKSRRARLCGCFGFLLKSRKNLTSDPTSMREGRRDGEIYYALKTIVMSRISPAFIDELRNEIDILKGLDHPNIVKAFEVFESRQQIFIVMELCAGGDLYRHLPYSEKDAASITAKLCSAIAYMHGKDVVHRDLKFENIMFETAAPDSEIKIIDFGLSKKFRPGDHNKTMTEGVGTIYTMAPQVIRGTAYTSKADLWSLGVITFMLLASQKPFKGKKRRQVVEHIMRCDYSFESEIWRTLSAESKDFIRHLLVIDPDERMDAKTALKHRWLSKEYKLSDRRPDEELMRKVEDSLLAYKYTSALKKVALNVIARKSTPREIFQLRKAFGQYDIENDGTISFEEFKEALKQSNYSDKELAEIFSSIEVNAIGHIMYTEFLAATLEVKGCVEEERIADAFDRLDYDESGYISPQDLRELLVGYSEKEIQALIAEADTDHDGQISFEEFKKIFNKRTETFAAKAISLDQELPAAEAPVPDKKTPVASLASF